MAVTDSREAADRQRRLDPDHQLPPANGAGDGMGIIPLLRELADDTRTLVQQEIQLAKAEAVRTAKRVVVDSAWIGAGVAIIAVGGLCLVLALALGLGALLGSYWLGTLITGGILFLIGALAAWKGARDLRKGGFAPTETTGSLRADKEWAEREMDDFKHGLKKERA